MHSLIIPAKRVLAKFFGTHLKFSFSQVGEDLIIKFMIDALGLKAITYLDIGANHPCNMNNTYLLYLHGMTGVCVEPNPTLFRRFRKLRKRDQCLNVGVGIGDAKTGTFYEMDNPLLSTFSEEEANRMSDQGEAKIVRSTEVALVNINELIRLNFDSCPDYISLDVEGIDVAILKALDFKKYRPKFFCIETISYSTNLTGTKSAEIIDLMTANGYKIFADTYINTIFVDQHLFA